MCATKCDYTLHSRNDAILEHERHSNTNDEITHCHKLQMHQQNEEQFPNWKSMKEDMCKVIHYNKVCDFNF